MDSAAIREGFILSASTPYSRSMPPHPPTTWLLMIFPTQFCTSVSFTNSPPSFHGLQFSFRDLNSNVISPIKLPLILSKITENWYSILTSLFLWPTAYFLKYHYCPDCSCLFPDILWHLRDVTVICSRSSLWYLAQCVAWVTSQHLLTWIF